MDKPSLTAQSPKKPPDMLQLYIEITQLRPVVWRRLLIPESITLSNLHRVLQTAFSWWNFHPHAFNFNGQIYGQTNAFISGFSMRAYNRTQLKTALQDLPEFSYTYDLDAKWEHLIVLEKREPGIEALSNAAICLDGANAAPPEDVGGSEGYEYFCLVMATPEHPEFESMRAWYGANFDRTFFDPITVRRAYNELKI